MDITVIVIEMLVFAAIFTVVCFAATSGRNNIQIDNYPPEIQEEYFKTHDKPAPAESTRAAAVSTFCYYSTAADFDTAAYADTACFIGAAGAARCFNRYTVLNGQGAAVIYLYARIVLNCQRRYLDVVLSVIVSPKGVGMISGAFAVIDVLSDRAPPLQNSLNLLLKI